MRNRPRIERAAAGGFTLRIPRTERLLLRSVVDELRARLDEPASPDLRRLFPPAHAADDELESEYRDLVGGDLLDGRLRALETVARTIDADALTADEADAWLRALNDARLVLGTRLDVTEETDFGAIRPWDPRARESAIYVYLSWLQEQVVEALSSPLP